MNDTIRVNEQFISIQGEGFYIGIPCYFIRLQGCDVNCRWCDSKATWDLDGGTMMTFQEIVDHIPNSINHVVITGGEPTLHGNLWGLIRSIAKNGYSVHIETSGTHYDVLEDLCSLPWAWWITLSPKYHRMPENIDTYLLANEVKWIITERKDLDIVDAKWEELERLEQGVPLFYLQPVSCEEEATDLCVQHVIKNADRDYRLSIQIHQYIGVK